MNLVSFLKKPSTSNNAKLWNSYSLSDENAISQDRRIQSFIRDSAPKLLLIPEAHGSDDAMIARRYVRDSKLYSFSEGAAGSWELAGIRGIESEEMVEKLSFLQFCKAYTRNQFQTPEWTGSESDFQNAVRDYAMLSYDEETKLIRSFKKAKTREDQLKFIAKRQIHDRDKFFAKIIKDECKLLKKSASVGVAFFGAAHLIPGYDNSEDNRMTNNRIPEELIAIGCKNRVEYIDVDGVHVYVYPKCIETDELEDDRDVSQELIAVLNVRSNS